MTVALSPDAKNSGWAVAWTPAAAGAVEYRAISPLGALRGEIGLIDQSTATALALTCLPPRPLLLLAFDEKAGETVFHDSSGNNRTATCSDDCPEAGVSGRFGNAAAFNGSSQALTVDGIALTSFTVATWLRRGDTGRGQTIAATGGPTLRFGFNENDTLFCDFGDATFDTVTTSDVYVDELWHHYACTFDAGSLRLVLYRDGVAVASAPTADSFSGDSTFYIGRSNLADSQVLNFNGEMENFLVVDRAMTAAEMADVSRRRRGRLRSGRATERRPLRQCRAHRLERRVLGDIVPGDGRRGRGLHRRQVRRQ
ncbi:MAG: LamG domain-containing protein [Caldilineaceae bacterium]